MEDVFFFLFRATSRSGAEHDRSWYDISSISTSILDYKIIRITQGATKTLWLLLALDSSSRMTMESTPKTWNVPKDPPPDFIASIVFQLCLAFLLTHVSTQTKLKRWLNECLPIVESLSDQELQKLVPMTNAREWLSGKVDLLRTLEQELEPVEWLAQGLWYEAGKTGPFDFDELYTIVGPSDDIAMDPPSEADKRPNVRSKLDEHLLRSFEANEIKDNLSALIQMPAVGLKRLSSAVRSVSAQAVLFSFAKKNVYGLGLPRNAPSGPS